MPDLAHTLATAETIAHSAGQVLREAYSQPRQIEYKGAIDLVTQADRAAEQMIVAALREAFPDHSILAEEGGGVQRDSGFTWFVDPLDGTTNFAHGFPVFAVSMALRDEGGLAVGVVFDPLRDECFTAGRGLGAALNGAPIRVSGCPDLDHALLATGFPYDRRTAQDNNTAAFSLLLRRCQGIRRAGAAALDMAYVACGRFDGFWEMRLQDWDVAAGMLIVREAGGHVTDYGGEEGLPGAIHSQSIIASNAHIHSEIIGALREVYPHGPAEGVP
jgi:myo-inositol-1(or 4)-monophosphatase